MGKSKKAVRTVLLLLTLGTVVLSGCGNNNGSAPSGQNARTRVQNMVRGNDGPDNGSSNARASHLEMLARGVHGVSDANCVIFGKYAIVGIDVDPTMERSRVGTTKYAVAEAFRKDPRGVHAAVTADMDLTQRIREIRADVQRGRPVAGFAEELADIVGRVMPNVGTPNEPAGRR